MSQKLISRYVIWIWNYSLPWQSKLHSLKFLDSFEERYQYNLFIKGQGIHRIVVMLRKEYCQSQLRL